MSRVQLIFRRRGFNGEIGGKRGEEGRKRELKVQHRTKKCEKEALHSFASFCLFFVPQKS